MTAIQTAPADSIAESSFSGGRPKRRLADLYLRVLRPLAPALAIATYAVLYLERPEAAVLHIMGVLTLSLIASASYVVAVRWVPLLTVLRASLVIDTLLVAGMVAALARPDALAIAYFWSVALAAMFVGMRWTLMITALAALCAVIVPFLVAGRDDVAVIVTDVLVLFLVGGITALLSGRADRVEQELERERLLDARALLIAGIIRSSPDPEDVLNEAVRQIGTALGAARCVVRSRSYDPELRDTKLYQWHRPDLAPLVLPQPPLIIQGIFESGETVAIDDIADADVWQAEFMQRVGATSFLVCPVTWRGRTLAVIGATDDQPRPPCRASMLPLIERLEVQLATALVQGETFRQQQESIERLERLTHMRDELIANISHELRTPLTTTIGFLKTLARTDIDISDEERAQFMQLALSQSEHLASLITDLLDFSRYSRGGLVLETTRMQLSDIVNDAVPGLGLTTRREVAVTIEDDSVVAVEAGRIRQVVTNLVVNALKHGSGRVGVRCAREDGNAVIAVTDEGDGVPHDRIPDLFLPFTHWGGRPDSSGLGLAIARGISEAHGGSLSYRPPTSRRAHEFVVSLPFATTTA